MLAGDADPGGAAPTFTQSEVPHGVLQCWLSETGHPKATDTLHHVAGALLGDNVY